MSRRPPAPLARQIGGRGEIAIRAAGPADGEAISRLAQLADRRIPVAPLLLAASDGEPVVVLSTVTGELVSDPFRATADLVDLLRLRAGQLQMLAA
jgi:hypothetical protein